MGIKTAIGLGAAAVLAAVVAYAMWHQPEPIAVETVVVQRGPVSSTVANTRAGTIEACRRAGLSSAVGGQISRLYVARGDSVSSGELLLELWNDDLAAALALAISSAETVRSQSRATCLRAEEAQRRADRLANLRQSGAVSLDSAAESRTTANALDAECKAARNQINVADSEVAVAQASFQRTRLFAPFDGVIADINGEIAEYVTPSPVGVATPPAIDLIDTACFKAVAPIDEVDAARVAVGMPATITLDAFRGEQFAGTVRRIASYVEDREKQARTVDVEVAFDHPQDWRRLLAGYSTDVEISTATRNDVLSIPSQAIFDRNQVYLLGEDQRLQQRVVETGLSNWILTEITAGLSAGDEVVTSLDIEGLAEGVVATGSATR